jgi:hypothetical protein
MERRSKILVCNDQKKMSVIMGDSYYISLSENKGGWVTWMKGPWSAEF